MLSNKELSIISDALLHLMASTNKAQEMVADFAAISAMKRANLEYRRLNDKICCIMDADSRYERLTMRNPDGNAVLCDSCEGVSPIERLCAFEEREELAQTFADSFDTKTWAVAICDMFEDVLHEHNILVPDDDRNGEAGEACLYGTTDQNLVDQVSILLGKLLTW